MLKLDWFHRLNMREQWLLVLGGSLLLLYLLYLLLLRPIFAENESLKKRNVEAAQSLQWMRSSAEQLKREGPQPTNQQSVAQILDSTVAQAGIKFSRFQPRGSAQGQVWFENTGFEQLIAWLVAIEKRGISVGSVNFSRTGQPGRVNATVQLRKGV